MPPTAPSNTSGTGSPKPSVIPDTQALKRAFDADFRTVLAQAQKHLGDTPSLAPRIAEGSFVRAWDARAQLQTADQLKAFLADDVKLAAERALARRAGRDAHAVAEPAPPIDLVASWQRVAGAIRQDPHKAQQEKDAADSMRHEAAEAVVTASRGMHPVVTVGAAIVLVVVVAAGVTWFNRAGTERAIAAAIAAPDGRVTSSAPGQLATVTLNDGTRVHLGPDSKLLVPKAFAGKIRVVKLDGAGAFDVAPGQPGDFRVYLRNGVVKATGTSFVVSGYWTDNAQIVQVREGSVSVSAGSQTTTLSTGHALLIDTTGATREPSADEVEEGTSWADGRLALLNRPLRNVLPMLYRWYQVSADVQDLKLLDRPVTMRAPVDSSKVALAEIEKSGGLTFDPKASVFRDTAAAKPARKSGKGKK